MSKTDRREEGGLQTSKIWSYCFYYGPSTTVLLEYKMGLTSTKKEKPLAEIEGRSKSQLTIATREPPEVLRG